MLKGVGSKCCFFGTLGEDRSFALGVAEANRGFSGKENPSLGWIR